MKQKLLFSMVLISILLIPAAALQAKTMYVRNWMTVSVRATPDEASQIIGNATTNDPVEVIEEGGGWSHIRTNKGKEGWVPARYLTPQIPATVSAQQCEEQIKALQDENRKLQELISKKPGPAPAPVQAGTAAPAPITAGAYCASLQKQYEKLQKDNKVLTDKYNALMEENGRLKTSENLTFTVIGGVFIIIGIIVGLLLQLVRGHSKKGGLRF
jgi:SH3 domain protein